MVFNYSGHHATSKYYCLAGESSLADSITIAMAAPLKGMSPKIAVDYHLYNDPLITDHL
jgi:hypothetical protein